MSKYYKISDLEHSDTAIAHGIDNHCYNPDHIHNMKLLMIWMDNITDLAGDDVSLKISSGYRCPELNKLIGGSPTSDHTKGMAFDFQLIANDNLYDLFNVMMDAVPYKQLIYEKKGHTIWIHYSFDPNDYRMEAMTSVNGIYKRINL